MQLTFDIGFLSLLNYYLVHFIHSCVNYIGLVCTGWPKNGTFCTPYKFIKYLPIFKLFFHCRNQEKICNNTVTKDPTTAHHTSETEQRMKINIMIKWN